MSLLDLCKKTTEALNSTTEHIKKLQAENMKLKLVILSFKFENDNLLFDIKRLKEENIKFKEELGISIDEEEPIIVDKIPLIIPIDKIPDDKNLGDKVPIDQVPIVGKVKKPRTRKTNKKIE